MGGPSNELRFYGTAGGRCGTSKIFPSCSKTISRENGYIIFQNWMLNNEINPMSSKLKLTELLFLNISIALNLVF